MPTKIAVAVTALALIGLVLLNGFVGFDGSRNISKSIVLEQGENTTIAMGQVYAEVVSISGETLIETIFTESFEDNSLSEYSGNKASFAITTDQVEDGVYALESTAVGSGRNIITDTGMTWSNGVNMSTYVYLTDNQASTWSLLYGVQEEVGSGNANTYEINLDANNNAMRIERRDSGARTVLVSSETVTFPTNEWLRVEVEWETDGTHTARVYNEAGTEIANATTVDTTYTTGGYGFGEFDETVYFDNLTVNSRESQTEFNSELYLQDEDTGVRRYATITGNQTKEVTLDRGIISVTLSDVEKVGGELHGTYRFDWERPFGVTDEMAEIGGLIPILIVAVLAFAIAKATNTL